ncbi:translation initiation factor IF-2-like [Tyto alba]|uniref:translation initiation factor IF-2-like n=1 Tax=Tyto alba TaxID=56313 RepID=UPI001C6662ED|nr:translation initiation factor IF-2-like [Tyto alba]
MTVQQGLRRGILCRRRDLFIARIPQGSPHHAGISAKRLGCSSLPSQERLSRVTFSTREALYTCGETFKARSARAAPALSLPTSEPEGAGSPLSPRTRGPVEACGTRTAPTTHGPTLRDGRSSSPRPAAPSLSDPPRPLAAGPRGAPLGSRGRAGAPPPPPATRCFTVSHRSRRGGKGRDTRGTAAPPPPSPRAERRGEVPAPAGAAAALSGRRLRSHAPTDITIPPPPRKGRRGAERSGRGGSATSTLPHTLPRRGKHRGRQGGAFKAPAPLPGRSATRGRGVPSLRGGRCARAAARGRWGGARRSVRGSAAAGGRRVTGRRGNRSLPCPNTLKQKKKPNQTKKKNPFLNGNHLSASVAEQDGDTKLWGAVRLSAGGAEE